MRLRPLACLLVVLTPTLARAASGGDPLTVSHSGYLLNVSDAPLEAPAASLTFRIVDQAASQVGEVVEWEASCAVAVQGGYYAVQLGAGACAGASTLDGADLPPGAARWLEVVVGGVTLVPRQPISPAPSATRASSADRLGTHVAADFATATHAHAVADVTGLQAALDARALASHVHAVADVTSLQAALDAKAPATHGHTVAEVGGLQAALDAKVSVSALTAPTVQTFTSGSGTFTTPAGALYLRVRLVGGGGGGSGSGLTGANGSVVPAAGGTTTFGPHSGFGGQASVTTGPGAPGGSATIGAGGFGSVFVGYQGGSYQQSNSANAVYLAGGQGGGTLFGGGPSSAAGGYASASAIANTGAGGSGGGGSGDPGTRSAPGGGGGGGLDAIIRVPAATYAWSIGAGGTGGSAGSSGYAGGSGASGYIEVTTYYQ